jgi:hypothetical protein
MLVRCMLTTPRSSNQLVMYERSKTANKMADIVGCDRNVKQKILGSARYHRRLLHHKYYVGYSFCEYQGAPMRAGGTQIWRVLNLAISNSVEDLSRAFDRQPGNNHHWSTIHGGVFLCDSVSQSNSNSCHHHRSHRRDRVRRLYLEPHLPDLAFQNLQPLSCSCARFGPDALPRFYPGTVELFFCLS